MRTTRTVLIAPRVQLHLAAVAKQIAGGWQTILGGRLPLGRARPLLAWEAWAALAGHRTCGSKGLRGRAPGAAAAARLPHQEGGKTTAALLH
jgi:hypothetical protein